MKIHFKKLISIALIAAMVLVIPGLLPTVQAADANSTAGLVSVSSGSLNVRASASTSGAWLASLAKDSYVTLLSKSGSWWRVEYANGRYGYVSGSYITQVSGSKAATVTLSSGSLNVRTGAGTGYAVKASLYSGKNVVVLSTSNGWSRILYNGNQVGYVSATYLKSTGSSSTGSSSSAVWPVPASGKLNQYFVAGSHLGIDIAPVTRGVSGDRVVSAYDGKVVYAGWLNGYGYVVYVNSYVNGQYIQTRYGHLSGSPYVSAGSTVYAGQAIGAMGNTGTSSGVHLHFEVRIRHSSADCIPNADSTPVNPLNYVSYK